MWLRDPFFTNIACFNPSENFSAKICGSLARRIMTTVNLLGKYGMPMVPKLSKGISESHRISELWRFRLCFCYNFIKHRSPGPSIFWGNDEFHLADSPWGPAPPGDSLPSWLNFEPGSLLFAGAHRAVDIWVIPAERYMTSNDLNGKHLKGKMWKKEVRYGEMIFRGSMFNSDYSARCC